ncbi:MAG TPA: hypothetical protein VF139_09810 [Candidatus Polarisedimenticolaceae bacterium]
MHRNRPLLVLLVAVFALALAGCEDSGLTAPSDGSVIVRANPSTVVIDPSTTVEDPPGSGNVVPQSSGTSQISAQIFDADGKPQEGISVSFTTTGGTLASANAVKKTDANGIALDTLTLRTTDASEVEVTAASAAINAKVAVKRQILTANRPPQGVVVIAPRDQQGVGKQVVFDGTASVDPEDDPITMYRWTVTSNNPDDPGVNPLVIEGPAANSFNRIFANVQDLAGSLQVTDDPLAPAQYAAGDEIAYPSSTPFVYKIVRVVCTDNKDPVAVISGDTIRVSGLTGQQFNIQLDGTLSTDPDQVGIADWVWNCGNNRVAAEQPPDGSKAVCTYVVGLSTQTYTATLNVKDKGTGVFNDSTGDWECAKVSPSDSVTVVVELVPTQ